MVGARRSDDSLQPIVEANNKLDQLKSTLNILRQRNKLNRKSSKSPETTNQF